MLSLTSDAVPELPLDALDAACRARGLDGEELVVDADAAAYVAARARVAGARVVALRVRGLDERTAPAVARGCALLDVPASVRPGALDLRALAAIADAFARAGSRLLIGHGTSLDEALATIAAIDDVPSRDALGLAWEIHPSSAALDDAGAVLLATRERLGLVRLHGGGPEQRDQDGRGIGAIVVDLAVSGYTGPIVLCPSRPDERPRWDRWLRSTKSAGCGTAVSASAVTLDVRDVEPRNRLETILGAYRGLVPGGTLELTVDHDPVCMYYTLQATEPEGSFTFETVEHGPEVWRAHVLKR